MAQDEHTSKCSNSSGGGGAGGGGVHRSTKKLKHKKAPQRGLGVAQLEKIISEEHQTTDSTDLTHNSIISPSNSSSNFQKLSNFRSAPISIPPPPPLPPNHHPLMSKTTTDAVSKPPNLIKGGGGKWSRVWNSGGGDFKFEGEKQSQNQNYVVDHNRFTAPFPTNLGGLPYESNPPIWPPPTNLMLPRSQHFQSSVVNVSANTSSSSSVTNFQMEPPSNQMYSGNNYQPLWPEEEKMVGMKRSYPFSLENVPIPSFHCKFPSAYISRSDEYASCSNGGTAVIEPAHAAFRENHNTSSSGVLTDAITQKFIDENQILTRDFLKLAPPHTSQSNSNSKESSHLSLQKDKSKDPTHLSGRDGSNPQHFLSFLPAAKTSTGQSGSSNGETGESVDLNLKL